MADNNKLLKVLREAKNLEEMIVPIYIRHLTAAVFWAGMSQDRVEKTKETLKRLAVESEAHGEIVKQLIIRLEGK